MAIMPDQPRYAIYYVPEGQSAFYRFGAATLGYDAIGKKEVQQPQSLKDAVDGWRELTEDPRRYGFHATLKAPFRLSSVANESSLLAAFEAFVKRPRTIPVIRPVVRLLRHFVAIFNDAPNSDLSALADACVIEFETFRAVLTAQDRERRLKSRLTPAQIALLDRWGYPYVFDEFFFHMSLTGRVPREQHDSVHAVLASQFALLSLQTLAIDQLALLRQDYSGASFHVIAQAALTPEAR